MRPIRRQYLYDAIARLQGSHKKVAKLMLPTLFNLVRHAVEKGRDPLRLYIYGALIGKTKRYKLIRYHAKGRHGLMKRDYCQIRIVV
jgi:large subunit ribosomal protein L22